ncbi:hypothetical protein [Halorubrum sp. Atlit-26R]|uniref:hypothetical protein n=1 Tax=Halorubrum sp. Atlit-26R TaxID=2282128 RepID=UPI0011C437CC|nr:hypothetical protein [Halorubrum sp. Atlit-26R]
MSLTPVGGSPDEYKLHAGDVESTPLHQTEKEGKNTRDHPIIVSARAIGADKDWTYEGQLILYVNGQYADLSGYHSPEKLDSNVLMAVSAIVPAGGTYRAYAPEGNLQLITEQEIYVSQDDR